jgi:far upstream element-binding protein
MGRPDDERIFVTVPSSAVGLIIGRGGETVRSMQDQSGARVKIDPSNDPNSDERTVNISGDPQCVAIAKQLVEEKVAEATRGSGGRHGGYNNNDRGGYRSQNDYGNDYNQQQGSGEGGYDYNQQYSQYYQQYGYDQSQYNNSGNEGI